MIYIKKTVSTLTRPNVRFGSFATEPFNAGPGQCPLLLQ